MTYEVTQIYIKRQPLTLQWISLHFNEDGHGHHKRSAGSLIYELENG
jgi:hypothetical protein